MNAAFEQRVRERAYEIWVAAGMEGAADAHWLSAEQSVKSEAEQPKVKAAKPVKTKAAKPAVAQPAVTVRKTAKADAKSKAAAIHA